MSAECIFCRIAAGEIPSVRVFEDDDTLAFLDIAPIIRGHTLVIPRAHYDPLTAVPSALLARLVATVQRVAAAQLRGLGADGVNIHQANGAAAGQVVPHVHFHVIPRFCDDGHRWNWAAGACPTPAEMSAVAEKIRRGLSLPAA